LIRTTFARGDGTSTGLISITPALGGNATNATGCLVLDGVDDWQQHANTAGLSLTDGAGNDKAMTISAFVYQPSAAGVRGILFKEDFPSGTEYGLALDAGRPWFVTAASSGSTGKIRRGSTTINSNMWTHVAATYDGSKTVSGIKLFVNGVEETSYTTVLDTAAGMSATSANVYFGISSGIKSPNYYDFSGKLMDLLLVEGALASAEIYGLYISGKDKTRP
jgi:hypothetical protein